MRFIILLFPATLLKKNAVYLKKMVIFKIQKKNTKKTPKHHIIPFCSYKQKDKVVQKNNW